MDTTNQSASQTSELLKQWWDTKIFEGKEYCSIDDNGALKIAPFSDKIVTVLNHITGDSVIQNLIEKYKDLEKQIKELNEEWAETEDKLKLISKVSRLQEHISHANAIGDLKSLLHPLQEYGAIIQKMIDENYAGKLSLIAEAESLSVENNNWKDLTNKFRDISEKWKKLGYVDKKRNDALWEKLEAIKSKFFEDKRTHQDDIEKELLQNLDLKMELVEKAEFYASSENWKETTEIFKQLLEEWKQIGRTLPEKNEMLWQKFIAAKNNFFDRKKIHTDQIKVEQEDNYLKKLTIVQKAETIKDSTDWAITTQAFTDLTNEWKGIGAIPSEHGNSLWDRFSAAKESFFQAKRDHSAAYKAGLEENLEKKKHLIERAEAIKNSSNWREATEEMNQLFEQWKQVGHVGKEHSEPLWAKFISARKHFFNRKDQDRERRKQQYEKNKELHYIQTKNFLTTLENESIDEEDQLKEFRENINNIGEGPKSEELRKHLSNLIVEIEQRLKNRSSKILALKEQIKQLEQEKSNNKDSDQGIINP